MPEIPFNMMFVNKTREGIEVIFQHYGKWYRMNWENVPERFKHLYYAKLKLEGKPIPDFLKPYEVKEITIENAVVRIDLDDCEEIPETYPLMR